MTLDLLRSLLERALYALARGWTAAAIDALGRALRLVQAPPGACRRDPR